MLMIIMIMMMIMILQPICHCDDGYSGDRSEIVTIYFTVSFIKIINCMWPIQQIQISEALAAGATSALTTSTATPSCLAECARRATAPTTGTARRRGTATPTPGSASSASSSPRAPSASGARRATGATLSTASATSAPAMSLELTQRGWKYTSFF